MTGPEHYRAAEGLLATPADPAVLKDVLAAAQVHATLAHAAATALCATPMVSTFEFEAWHFAAGTPASRGADPPPRPGHLGAGL